MQQRILLILSIAFLTPPGSIAQGLIIPSGAYLIANTGNIALQSNWVNNGSFTHNGGTVLFTGTTQTLGGSSTTTFNNITIGTSSATTITSSGQQLKGILQSNNTLNANGNLTLLSTATQTAAIDGSGTGEVLGNLTMQRYLASGFGYKYFSAPFQSDTVGDFADAINLATSFPDVYKYDESQPTAGWVTYTTSSNTLTPLAGYAVNFGTSSAPLTVNLTGVVNNHTISATLFNHNQTYTLGFNLAGNPYPSPIDWNSATGWTKTNIDNAIYFFSNGTTSQYTGTYSSYINGVSSNGIASNIVAAMQGFFIHVSNGSFPVTGLLSVNNNARNTQPSVTFFGVNGSNDPPPLLRLHAGFSDDTTLADPVVIYLKPNAPTTFDKTLDALKLMNTRADVPSLYTISTDNTKLSIQALPYPGGNLQVVPLGLVTAQDGWITFIAGELRQAPAFAHIYLSDTQSGIDQDLSLNPSYSVHLTKGAYENRFFLNFSPAVLSGTTTTPGGTFDAYNGGDALMIRSDLPAGEKARLLVCSAAGQVLYRGELNDNAWHTIPLTAAGVYIISFNDGHETTTKKIFVGGHP